MIIEEVRHVSPIIDVSFAQKAVEKSSKDSQKIPESLNGDLPCRTAKNEIQNTSYIDMYIYIYTFSCVRSRILLSCAGLTLFFRSLVKVRP